MDTHTGREYLRVSYDRSGRQRSTDEQHADNDRAAAERGVRLGEAYRENGGASASRYARKSRDAFGELLGDLQGDRFAASELWLWEASRGSRKVGEWVRLIDLCEQRKVRIHVTTHGRTYDPANGRDRRTLLEDAVDSEYESSKTSVRATRAAAANAAEGRPHGPAPYGYVRTFDPKTRRLAEQSPHPEEAPVVRELYARLVKGHSLRAIAADLAERGIRRRGTRGSDVFTAQHLRDMALNPAYMAMRAHRPNGTKRRNLDNLTPGTWPPLVDPETWWSVHRMLTAPERKTTRPGRAVHLLSRIGRCDVCGGPLSATYHQGRRRYGCHQRGCVRVDADPVDQLAEEYMLGYLGRDDVYEELSHGPDDDAELSRVRGDLAEQRAALAATENAVPADVHEARAFAATARGQAQRVAELEERERELTTPSVLRGLIEPGQDVAKRWKAAPMSSKREIARALLSPGWLGELRVTRGLRVPAADRVRWHVDGGRR